MGEETRYTIGSDVLCTDGVVGDLTRVVVDPVRRALTHLVVEPHHDRRPGRLVPVELVASSGEAIGLTCTVAQFEALEDSVETEFLPGAEEHWGYPQPYIMSRPYYTMVPGGMGLGLATRPGDFGHSALDEMPRLYTHDRVPAGEVEIRRGEQVIATDGDIGQVMGLVVDPADQHVTHVLLDEGHLWGKKRVAIPIGAVTDVKGGVRLGLTKDQVRDLPPAELAQDA
jgi:sporulation protein YlmC with PRC-barrel domain